MKKAWWHGKVAYQIYPKSFCDSNGDGVGDLGGIIEHFDYLCDLGVDIIWLSPIFVSPFVDNGYDIADYRRISPLFGTMEQFEELLRLCREHDMHILLDLVINHCSSEHPYFKQALKNPEGEEGNYFYFVRGKQGLPPDNLRSYFGGSVWEKVDGYDDLYYLHYFAKEQPDLNWYNIKVREKLYDMVNFWLDKGVSGFRIDAIMNIVKDLSFPGLPPDEAGDGRCHANRMTAKLAPLAPRFLNELKERTFKPHQALTVAEAFGLSDEIYSQFVGDDGCFSTVFDFTAREKFEAQPNYFQYPEADVQLYRDSNFKMQEKSNQIGFICPILENHDEPRAVSLYLKKSQQNAQGAQALATAFMFLRGLPFIYQGQELGMTNTHFEKLEEFNDLQAHDEYRKCINNGFSPEQAVAILDVHSRDNARTPMLWTDGANAGFSTGKPWLKVHQDYKSLNVRTQLADPKSTLHYYRRLIALRKDPQWLQLFTYGEFVKGSLADPEVIDYARVLDTERAQIVASFKDGAYQTEVGRTARILISTGEVRLEEGILTLKGAAACVLGF
ncbi:MAG: alpha-glucosidase [Succinivibrio sp.]|nr:alpha-glucosidase [Succinivibrio sp.]